MDGLILVFIYLTEMEFQAIYINNVKFVQFNSISITLNTHTMLQAFTNKTQHKASYILFHGENNLRAEET